MLTMKNDSLQRKIRKGIFLGIRAQTPICSFFFFNTLILQEKWNMKWHFLMQKKKEQKLLAQMVSNKVEDTLTGWNYIGVQSVGSTEAVAAAVRTGVASLIRHPFTASPSTSYITCHCNIQTFLGVYKWILLSKKTYPFCRVYYLF